MFPSTTTIDLRKAVKDMVEDYDFDETCTYKFELIAYDKNYNILAVQRSNTWGYKAPNSLSVSGKTAKVKKKKVRKKKQTLSVSKVLRFGDLGQGKLSYRKLSGSKKITINASTGKVTVKKKTKKGTYKVTVLVRASGDDSHIKTQKKVTFKIKVK